MSFDIEGVVVDEAGMPIRHITVEAESAEPVKTDENGCFSIHGSGIPGETTAIRFIDEYDDGISYIPKTVVIDLVTGVQAAKKCKEGNGWDAGSYRNASDVVVEMTREESASPDASV